MCVLISQSEYNDAKEKVIFYDSCKPLNVYLKNKSKFKYNQDNRHKHTPIQRRLRVEATRSYAVNWLIGGSGGIITWEQMRLNMHVVVCV